MMIKQVRLGADAELKTLPSGQTVANLSAAYDVGFGQNKKTQWIRLAMFGERAQKSAQHLTKGKAIVAVIDDIHIDTFDGTNGPVSNLKGTLVNFEFSAGGSRDDQQAPRQQQAPAPEQRQRPAAPPPAPVDNFDDDIPF